MRFRKERKNDKAKKIHFMQQRSEQSYKRSITKPNNQPQLALPLDPTKAEIYFLLIPPGSAAAAAPKKKKIPLLPQQLVCS